MSDVTIVVPNWNGLAVLENLLRSLRAQTLPIAEIVVVDNGSTDGSAEAAEKAGARVIRLGRNTGFAAAVNRGIAESRTDLVAVVNNDVTAAADWLARLVDALDEGAWFAVGKILQADGRRLDGTYDAICRGGCACRVGHGVGDGTGFSTRRRIFFPPGTAALFRRELFERIGGFDEAFESYMEDVDLGLRCALAGLSGWYVPEAVAWHRGSATLGRWNRRVVRLISRNQVWLVRKHYPGRLVWRFGWAILVAQVLWGVVALRHGAGLAWVRGKIDGMMRKPGVDAGRGPGGPPHELRRVLEESERDIPGCDSYWRWYFRLAGGGRARG